jgi:hypothetical protein
VQFRLSHSSSSAHESPSFEPPAHALPQLLSCVHERPAFTPAVQDLPHWASVVQASPSFSPRKQVLPHAGGTPLTHPVKLALQFSAPLQNTPSSQNSAGSGVCEHSPNTHASEVQNTASLQWGSCRHSAHESDASSQNGVAGFIAGQFTGVPFWQLSLTHVSTPLQ